MSTYEEWRVTGISENGPFDVVWSPARNALFDGGETEARRFVELTEQAGGWTVGPHLHRRTVTVTDWQEVDLE